MSDYIAKQGTTALGIIGTALGGLATAGGLTGIMGGCTPNYITKDYAQLMNSNSAKDAEIALLRSNADTDAKLVQVYTAAAERDKNIRQEINDAIQSVRNDMNKMHENQLAINAAQAVDNATTSSALAVLSNNQQSIQQTINNLTKVVIPNSNVCPGWGPVNIYPAPSTYGTTIG